MKGVIVSYRTGRHTQNPFQMIIKLEGVTTKEEAEKLVGKEVIWTTQTGKEIKGTVSGAHGNKGVVRARFRKGMPGQSLGTEIILK